MAANLSSMSCSSFSRIILMLLFLLSLTFLCSTFNNLIRMLSYPTYITCKNSPANLTLETSSCPLLVIPWISVLPKSVATFTNASSSSSPRNPIIFWIFISLVSLLAASILFLIRSLLAPIRSETDPWSTFQIDSLGPPSCDFPPGAAILVSWDPLMTRLPGPGVF